jgi:hypothetical protein
MAMWKVTSDKGVTHDCAGPDTIFLHEYVAWNAEAVRSISFCGAEAATPLQVPIPRSKDVAFWNMDSIFVTLLVSHKLMSPLKIDLS